MRALFFAILLFGTLARANLVQNGSFEQGNFVPNGQNTMSLAVGASDLSGWQISGDSIAWIADPNPFNGLHASQGVKSLDLTGYSDSPPHGGVQQTIATAVGATYVVSFDLGTHSAFTTNVSLRVSAGDAEQDFSLVSSIGQTWQRFTLTFNAIGPATTIRFSGLLSLPAYIGLDNISVSRVGRGSVGPPKTQGTQVELVVTRADGQVERYMTLQPVPSGRRSPPIYLTFGERVNLVGRLVDNQGSGNFPGTVIHSLSNSVCSFSSSTGTLVATTLGTTILTSRGANPGQPVIQSTIYVLPPAVVAFSDWDPLAFGTGAIKTYLYVPGARVNSPDGDKIWEVPYRDDAYLGRA
ncbi:MAG: DUF642 domain-containing protein, partial [Fimbriimonadaceae bacterium]|nr:DUF642 domain-containing protein [Fimbriimonadaceae bacterium]